MEIEEINELKQAILDDIFDFNRETFDLFENNIIPNEDIILENQCKSINEEFYNNNPLAHINKVKKYY